MTIDLKAKTPCDVNNICLNNLSSMTMSSNNNNNNINKTCEYLTHSGDNGGTVDNNEDTNNSYSNGIYHFAKQIASDDDDGKSDETDSEEDDSESSDDSSEEEEEEEDVEDRPSEEMKERWKELDKFASPVKVTNSQIDLPAYDPSGEFRNVLNQSDSQYLLQNDSQSNKAPVDSSLERNLHNNPPQSVNYDDNLETSVSSNSNEKSLSGLDSVLSQYHRPGCDPAIGDSHPAFTSPIVPNKRRPYRRRQKYHEMYNGYANADVPNELGQYVCPNCGRIYTNRSSLRSHIKKHYPDEQKRYRCQHCNYSSHYYKNLSKHVDLHHNENSDHRIYRCQVCDKPFLKEDQLLEHKKLHTADNTYICETCGKQFKTKLRLKYHMDVHNPDKPFVCDIGNCDRAFRTPKYLKNHKDEYHKLQPKIHYCPVESCTMYFQRKSHLKRHMATHDGEKNYHCNWPDCKRSFRSQETLTVHYYRHTGAKPFNCELCSSAFRQKSALIYHYKHHHSKDSNSLPSHPAYLQHDVGHYAHITSKSNRLVAGGRPTSSAHVKSMDDVYSFGNDGGGVHLDDHEEDMGPHIDGIINHLMEEPNRVASSMSCKDGSLLRRRIDAIVSEIFIRGSINLAMTLPLTDSEIFLAEEALAEVLSARTPTSSPVKRSAADLEPIFSPMSKSYSSQHSSSRNASPMKCATPRSMIYESAYESGAVEQLHSRASLHNNSQRDIDEEDVRLAMNAIDCRTAGEEHFPGSTGNLLMSSDIESGVQDLSVLSAARHGEHLVNQAVSSPGPALTGTKEGNRSNSETVLGNNGGDLLDQVLEDLKGIEQDNLSSSPDQVQDLTCPSYIQSQGDSAPPAQSLNLSKSNKQSSTSSNPTTIPQAHSTSADSQQQPKSLDSSLWSDSGYSSGHEQQQNKDAGQLPPQQLGSLDSGLTGSGSDNSDPSSGSSGNPLLDAYNNYSRQQQTNPYLGMPNPYDAAVYARSAAVMGDHLRSLTALGSKYMDSAAGQYSGASAGLSERSLSGLGTGIPPWSSSSSYGSGGGVAASGLQYPWAPPNLSSGGSSSPTGFSAASAAPKIGNAADYSGYADYLTARASLNPFSAGNKEVEAYRSALNDYSRGFSQDLYSQMAAGGYDKYTSLYSARESAFYNSNQRPFPSIGGSSESAFQNTSATVDRSSYMTGNNPFYPSSQYYLAASRQLSGAAAASGLADSYRSSMLHSMPPFTRYPF